jgi:hypothetical protein
VVSWRLPATRRPTGTDPLMLRDAERIDLDIDLGGPR